MSNYRSHYRKTRIGAARCREIGTETKMLAHCKSLVRRLIKDRSGVTALEYGLIASLIAVTIISSVALEGTRLSGVFTDVASKL